MAQLNGIDISSWQDGLNVASVAADFVIIKATGGKGYVNPSCDKHFQQAKTSNKRRGVYHFRDDGFPGTAQEEADYFVDNIKGYLDGNTLLVLDWEDGDLGNVAWARAWLDRVKDRTGVKPMIYMSESVVNSHDWSRVIDGDYGLWVAKYRDYEVDHNYDMSTAGNPPNVKWGEVGYAMWQWTSAGRLDGYGGNLDLNAFYGDGATWDAYCGKKGGSPTPTPQPQPVPAPAGQTVYVVKEGDNLSSIAAQYGTSYQKIAADNGIANPSLIYPGQKLVINGASNARPDQKTYTVKEGDNLSSIGAEYGVSYQAIAQANGISNPDLIHPGQVLIIP